jgi:hypothetical protein
MYVITPRCRRSAAGASNTTEFIYPRLDAMTTNETDPADVKRLTIADRFEEARELLELPPTAAERRNLLSPQRELWD